MNLKTGIEDPILSLTPVKFSEEYCLTPKDLEHSLSVKKSSIASAKWLLPPFIQNVNVSTLDEEIAYFDLTTT